MVSFRAREDFFTPKSSHCPEGLDCHPPSTINYPLRLWLCRTVAYASVTALLLCAGTAKAATYLPSLVVPPKPMREYRAAWIASVANIDLPSQKGLTTAEQKSELTALLDRATQLKLNTVILQVRPACDTLYASQIEPWSEYLTGTMGKAPE